MTWTSKNSSLIRSLVRLKTPVSRLSVPGYGYFEYLLNLFEFGKWCKQVKIDDQPKLDSRYKLYEYLNETIIGTAPIDYLEFGVWEGVSIRRWVGLNRHPGSTFQGFDTFSGLPEDWAIGTRVMAKGTFDTHGQTPQIDDPRVRFYKGLFQDTLPGFRSGFVPQNRLVVHLDADLYSSTLYVLTMLHQYLRPGTILMFDEFSVLSEFRAYRDYLCAYGRKCRPLGSAGLFYDYMALEVTL